MSVIKGVNVLESASLTTTKELHYTEKNLFSSFVVEECQKAFKKGYEKGEKIGYERAHFSGRRGTLLF